jgi:hypothetical protein
VWIQNVEVIDSPLIRGHARLRGEVICRDPAVPPEVYWIDLPASMVGSDARQGNFWLTLLAPLAVNLREPLTLPEPVDPELLANVHELMRVWQCWYPDRPAIAIEANVAPRRALRCLERTASMFSGGVDAWFTLLAHNSPDGPPGNRIDDLLCVWGLDVLIGAPSDFGEMKTLLSDATESSGAVLVEIATNVRETQWWRRGDWGKMAHGCLLGATAHAFGSRYGRLLIPSSHRYDDLSPWGSHPLTDRLLSSGELVVEHDGAGYSRVDKIRRIAQHLPALESLQVCWETGRFDNCGRCLKCYRTMATLDVLGALQGCKRLLGSEFHPVHLARMLSQTPSELIYVEELRQLAVEFGRADIAAPAVRSLLLSHPANWALRLAKFCADKPALWRLREPIQNAVWQRMMT